MNKTNIIRCSIFLMFIFGCTAKISDPEGGFGSRGRRDDKKIVPRKMTKEENEKRLKECGKSPKDKRIKFENPWFGTYGPQNLWTKLGVVLISEYHAIASKSVVDYKKCTESKKLDTVEKGDFNVHFSKTGDPEGKYTTAKLKLVTQVGACEKGKQPSEAIQILEFKEKVNLPYACVLSDETDFDLPLDNFIFPMTYLGDKKGTYHKKQKGTLKKVDGKLVWDPKNKTIVPPENDSREMSMPLLTEGERTTVSALIYSYDSGKNNFKVTPLQPFLQELCNSFNICPGPSTTTTSTTTTTASTTTTTTTTTTMAPTTTTTTETTKTTTTTEPPTTTTTYYIPAILGDPEMMDFEMPFEGPLVKRWGSGAESLNHFVVFVVLICLVMV